MTNSILNLIQTKFDKEKTATEKASGKKVALKYNTDYTMSTQDTLDALRKLEYEKSQKKLDAENKVKATQEAAEKRIKETEEKKERKKAEK